MISQKTLRIVFALLLLLIVVTQGSPFAQAQLVVRRLIDYSQPEKGLVMDARIALFGTGCNGPCPTLSELKQAGFTLVGTIVYDWYADESGWSSVGAWLKTVHDAGFRTFLNFWAPTETALTWTKRAASLGVDVIAFDELIARNGMTKAQLLSLIDAGLTVNPRQEFIVNEYVRALVTNAYEWTSGYRSVRVATDNYDDLSIIDVGIQLAAKYNKRPLVWLIFSNDNPPDHIFECYKNLDTWIAYVKQRGVDGLFWYVDSEFGGATWRAQWEKVVSF